MDAAQTEALRRLPAVQAVVLAPAVAALEAQHEVVVRCARQAIDEARQRILRGDLNAGDTVVAATVSLLAELLHDPYPPVINGTGVVVQTNLGRAPVSTHAARAMAAAASGYMGLETVLASGERGGRGSVITALLRVLTGAEQSLVVNNNASAVFLALRALCGGREVLVSRGEAVEIGGGFRIPDVLRQSGAVLVEVGTTNRTYAHDYVAAINERTAAILRVHASNFAITGFTARPELRELAEVAHAHDLLLLEDVGSGCLLATERFGLEHEPTLAESIAAGADLVCASGDKLLGGPQAGIAIGRTKVIETMRRHPLARALRADKTCLAGLAATLQHYARGDAEESVPVWWMLSRTAAWLEQRVATWLAHLDDGRFSSVATQSVVGGGSLPGKTLPSYALSIVDPQRNADVVARVLRSQRPIVFPRVEDQRVLIDARTVLPEQDDELLVALKSL
ncbi:MAG: L-seryl-tRNA(Sec) selenium transferase [Chloroflexi bacterium]|nr:MAG: L-seryl-tRNA(Sec) selenium transferase [Chloroflexota bacterium]